MARDSRALDATTRRPRPFRAPVQARSERTLEAILAAAEALLAERPLAAIGIHEILRRAGCSAGSFYARFRAKEDLLPLLYARYDAALRPAIERRAARTRWDRLDLAGTVERLVSEMVALYRERRTLLREMALYARAQPQAVDAGTRARRAAVHELPVRLLARFRDRIPHPDPEAAIRTALYVAAAAARDKVLFGDAPHAKATPLSLPGLERALARMVTSYLTEPPGGEERRNARPRRGSPGTEPGGSRRGPRRRRR